jgi:DNA topoisomerase-1
MEQMTNERAYELLQVRREYIEANGGPKKKSGTRKAAAKKAPAKKAAAKKTAAKKATPKKKASPKEKPAAESEGE